jgi:hypothetical protein
VQIDLAALPDDPATLQHLLREVVAAAEQQHSRLQERCSSAMPKSTSCNC